MVRQTRRLPNWRCSATATQMLKNTVIVLVGPRADSSSKIPSKSGLKAERGQIDRTASSRGLLEIIDNIVAGEVRAWSVRGMTATIPTVVAVMGHCPSLTAPVRGRCGFVKTHSHQVVMGYDHKVKITAKGAWFACATTSASLGRSEVDPITVVHRRCVRTSSAMGCC